MEISKQQLNIITHLEAEVTNQTNCFKRAISELKTITHIQKVFLAESDVEAIRVMIDKLEKLIEFVGETKTTTTTAILNDKSLA